MQEQEQEKLLEEASAVVREQGCYMKRAIVSFLPVRLFPAAL